MKLALYNLQLIYNEGDIQYPVLVPKIWHLACCLREKKILEQNPKIEDESDWNKWQRYIKRSKDFTAQKIKFSITDFFTKSDQIRSFLRIWSYLL